MKHIIIRNLEMGFYSSLIGFVVGFVFSLGIVIPIQGDQWKHQAVNRGFAIYCPQNGQWAWIGECEK